VIQFFPRIEFKEEKVEAKTAESGKNSQKNKPQVKAIIRWKIWL